MVVLAWLGGAPAGGGAFSPPRDGLSLLWGVGVLAEYRRRGIAAAVGELLTRRAHAAGMTPFLEVEGPAERRLYERLGYRQVGVLTTISLPERIPAGPLVLEPVGCSEPGTSWPGTCPDFREASDGRIRAPWTACGWSPNARLGWFPTADPRLGWYCWTAW